MSAIGVIARSSDSRRPPSERQLALPRGRAAPARSAAGRLLEVLPDRALRARGDQRLGDALDVDVRAPPVAALVGVDRHDREDAVGADELAVAERDHANGLTGHRAEI